MIKYDPRNFFHSLIETVRLCYEQVACKLVVVGIGCEKFKVECQLAER